MFCTKCGTQLKEQDKFCSECGAATGRGATWQGAAGSRPAPSLSRPMDQAKIAGVCAGFARYFGLDVTLVRVLWVVLTVFPLPMFGLVSYFVAWIVMPKDPVGLPARVNVAN
jgi:phage shock protein C